MKKKKALEVGFHIVSQTEEVKKSCGGELVMQIFIFLDILDFSVVATMLAKE